MRILEYCADRADEGIRLELVLKRRLQLTDRQIRQLKYLPMGITVNSMQQRTTYCVCRAATESGLRSQTERGEEDIFFRRKRSSGFCMKTRIFL